MHWICHCFSFKSDMHQIKLDYYLIFRESQRNFDSFLMHCFEIMKFSYFDSNNLCCMHICYNELLIGDKKAWKIYTTIEIEKKQFFAVFDIVQMQYIETDDTQTSFYVVSIYLWTFVLFSEIEKRQFVVDSLNQLCRLQIDKHQRRIKRRDKKNIDCNKRVN